MAKIIKLRDKAPDVYKKCIRAKYSQFRYQVQGCFTGVLLPYHRCPHHHKLSQPIVCGNIFVNDEATSGIKRWTYGSLWSRSRVFTDFKSIANLTSHRLVLFHTRQIFHCTQITWLSLFSIRVHVASFSWRLQYQNYLESDGTKRNS